MVNIGSGNNSDRRGLSFVIFIGIIGFSIARGVATFFTNYLWFNSIDLTPIQIDLFGQSVVFMQNESQSVYNILASDGSMKVGLVIY